MKTLKRVPYQDSKAKGICIHDFGVYGRLYESFKAEGWTIQTLAFAEPYSTKFDKSRSGMLHLNIYAEDNGVVRIRAFRKDDESRIDAVFGADCTYSEFSMYQLISKEERYYNDEGKLQS